MRYGKKPKANIVKIGNLYRYGARFIMNNKLFMVQTEHLPQLLFWIRRNASQITSFEGNDFNSDRNTGVSYAEEMRDYFKVYAVCYYSNIPIFKFNRRKGYAKHDMELIKHPEATRVRRIII